VEDTAAPPGTLGTLVYTDEQLTLIADLAGEPSFPGARRPELDEAAWTAVAHGLIARGAIHDDDPPTPVRLVDAVLGVALYADRWLWITIDSQEEGASGQEILWLSGDARVRQTVTSDGFHRFATATIDELLGEVLNLRASAGAPAGPPLTLDEEEFGEFMDAACCVVSIECGRRIGEDSVEAQGLTLVESAEHGLRLLGDLSDGSIVLEAITSGAAGEHVMALVAAIG
jgi:hypothetical protein